MKLVTCHLKLVSPKFPVYFTFLPHTLKSISDSLKLLTIVAENPKKCLTFNSKATKWSQVEHDACVCLKAYSHRVKANTKAKKIKEQAKEVKEKISNIKENFRFCSTRTGLNNFYISIGFLGKALLENPRSIVNDKTHSLSNHQHHWCPLPLHLWVF